MSRGPGKVQQHILLELERRRYAFVLDLLPEGATKAMYNALNRAALKLANQGVIECKTFIYVSKSKQAKTLIALPGCMPEGRPERSDNEKPKCWTEGKFTTHPTLNKKGATNG